MRTRRTAIRAAVFAAVLACLLFVAAIALAAPAPATPTITSSPPNPSASTSAGFSFTGESGSTFECRLDAAAYAACSSPRNYTALTLASHTLRVRALKGGKTSGEAVYTWSVAAPAVPTIGTRPASPTNATGATFTFSTNAANATFECALDAPFSYGPCSSPRVYAPGLSAGSHEFRVRALGAAGSSTGTSAPASFAWTIDTTPPPAPSIDGGPASPTNSTSASFSFTDAEAGVSFLCRVDAAAFTACTSPRSYSGLAEGARTFGVKARDGAGNESGVTSLPWIIDTTPPAAPTITSKPADPASQAESTFSFTGEPGATFQCSVENGPFVACTSPFTFTVVVDTSNNGQHQFAVRAVDAAGNVSGATSYKWKVDVGFAITGNLAGPLKPGLELPLDLTLHNPFNFAIVVSNIQVTVLGGSSKAGCDGPTELSVTQSTATVTVPANGTHTLTGTQRPRLAMRNSATVSQDACKDAVFDLRYSGSATK